MDLAYKIKITTGIDVTLDNVVYSANDELLLNRLNVTIQFKDDVILNSSRILLYIDANDPAEVPIDNSDVLIFNKIITDTYNNKLDIWRDYIDANIDAFLSGNITSLLPFKTINKQDTGWDNTTEDFIDISYNHLTRTVSVTGTAKFYYQGILKYDLSGNPITFVHTADNGNHFILWSPDLNTWVEQPDAWVFTDGMLSEVYYNSTTPSLSICIREPHGLMDWFTHDIIHRAIGTIKVGSGGKLSNYTVNSTTPALRRPSSASSLIKDEDIPTNIAAILANGPYTLGYLSGSGASFTYSPDNIEPIYFNSINPQYNQLVGGSWQLTSITTNNVRVNYYVVDIPVAKGVQNQKFRRIFVAGQRTFTSLAAARAEDPRSLFFGNFSAVSAEFTIVARFTVRRNAGGWGIEADEELSVSRGSASSVTTGGLTSVETDGIYIEGNGQVGNAVRPTTSTTTSLANADTAFGWGDHAVEGYLTTETDPVFTSSPAASLTSDDLIDIGNLSGTNTGDQDLSGLVPYSGATSDVDLGEQDLTAQDTNFHSIQLDVNNDLTMLPSAPGLIQWNETEGTADLGLLNGTTQQIGQELYTPLVHNNTGVLIPNGSAVYFTGRHGNKPTIALAKGDSDTTACVVGLTTQDIADGNNGYITTFGYVRQIKTDYPTWAENDKLYLSKDTAGALTNIEPTIPHHSDIVGFVGVVGGAGIGSIYVYIKRHVTLEELSDVNGTPLTDDGQIPVWNDTLKAFDFTANINDYLLDNFDNASKWEVESDILRPKQQYTHTVIGSELIHPTGKFAVLVDDIGGVDTITITGTLSGTYNGAYLYDSDTPDGNPAYRLAADKWIVKDNTNNYFGIFSSKTNPAFNTMFYVNLSVNAKAGTYTGINAFAGTNATGVFTTGGVSCELGIETNVGIAGNCVRVVDGAVDGATPSAGFGRYYFKNKKPFAINSDGLPVDLTAGLPDVTARRLLGRATATNGEVEEIIVGGNLTLDPATKTLSAAGATLPSITANRILGRIGTNGTYQELPLEQGLSFVGTSIDAQDVGASWRLATTTTSIPATANTAIAFGNGVFVALSFSGTTPNMVSKISISYDGDFWEEPVLPTDISTVVNIAFKSITFGNGVFVMTSSMQTGSQWASPGQRGAISTDGRNWKLMTLPYVLGTTKVVFAGDRFFFFVLDNYSPRHRVYYSFDGLSWLLTELPTTLCMVDVTYCNGKYVALCYYNATSIRVFATSVDGLTWTISSVATFTTSGSFITSGNGVMIANVGTIASERLARSIDGITWTNVITDASIGYSAGCFNKGIFVITKSSIVSSPTTPPDLYQMSYNGTTWYGIKSPISNASAATYAFFGRMAYGNGIMLNIGYSGANTIVEKSGKLIVEREQLSVIGASDNKVVVPSDIEVSGDVRSTYKLWKQTGAIPNAVASNAVWMTRFGNGVFVSLNTAASAAKLIYSFDGITWITHPTFPTNIQFIGLVFVKDRFIAFPYNNATAYYSYDGVNWDTCIIPLVTNTAIYDCVYANNMFVAVDSVGGTVNKVAYSYDGITWIRAFSSAWSLFSIDYDGVRFRASSNQRGGKLATSVDGITWSEDTITVAGTNLGSWTPDGLSGPGTPALADGTGVEDNYYVATVAGIGMFGGTTFSFNAGDFVMYNQGRWVLTSFYPRVVRYVNGRWLALNAAAGTYNTSANNGYYLDWSRYGNISRYMILNSTDGVNWNYVDSNNSSNNTSQRSSEILYKEGFYLTTQGAINGNVPKPVSFMLSKDAVKWENFEPLIPNLGYNGSFAYGNGRFVILGTNGLLSYGQYAGKYSEKIVVKNSDRDIPDIADQNPNSPSFIKNSNLIAGEAVNFVTDFEGNRYRTIRIGNQLWTVDNWRSKTLNNGTPISNITNNAAWVAATTAAYSEHLTTVTSASDRIRYGNYYNYYAVDTANFAPVGWRVPSNADWVKLQTFMRENGYNFDGTTATQKAGKAASSRDLWNVNGSHIPGNVSFEQQFNNSSGLDLTPAGWRNSSTGVSDANLRVAGYYAASNNSGSATFRHVAYVQSISNALLLATTWARTSGLAVRFVRDIPTLPLPVRTNDFMSIRDYDGNYYKTVKVGNQIWTVDNWRCTKTNDGVDIPLIDVANWSVLASSGRCQLSSSVYNLQEAGFFYNYYAIDMTNFAPPGWRVPSYADYLALSDYLKNNGFNWNGLNNDPSFPQQAAKAIATEQARFWTSTTALDNGNPHNNVITNNATGLGMIPVGFKVYNTNAFSSSGNTAYLMLSDNKGSTASNRYISYINTSNNRIIALTTQPVNVGFPVRLVRDAVERSDSKSATFVSPSATGDAAYLSGFYTPSAIIITAVRVMVYGGTSITLSVLSGTTFRTAVTTHVSSQTVNSGGSVNSVTIANVNIPANSQVWFQITAVSGVVQQANVTVEFTW